MILLDTNVLTRLTNDGHPNCAIARNAVSQLLRRGERLVLCPQAIFEFWAVATRDKSNNGLGMPEPQAAQWIAFFRRRFLFTPDPETLAEMFVATVQRHGIKGFLAHDARFIAYARCLSITQLLTFDGGDFAGLPIQVVDPHAI